MGDSIGIMTIATHSWTSHRTSKRNLPQAIIEVRNAAAKYHVLEDGRVPTVMVGQLSPQRWFTFWTYQAPEGDLDVPHAEKFIGKVTRV